MMSETKRRNYNPAPAADRVPPQAIDVERTILGSMLIDGTAVDVAMENLKRDDFYMEAHAKIFDCMTDLSRVNTPVDIITVAEKLRAKGWMEEIGSEAYLSEITGSAVTSGNVQYYADIVRDKAILRKLISTSAEITTNCFSTDMETQEVLDGAATKIMDISDSRSKTPFVQIKDLIPNVFNEIKKFSEDRVNGVPTGFRSLDEKTTGLQNGDLIIVGGRPSMGKTAFCLAIAQNAAIKFKVPTAIFSLEMTANQLAYRMLCSEARIDMHLLRSGRLPARDHGRLSLAAGPLNEAPIFIDDTSGISVLELKAKARRLKRDHNLSLIIVDYLQLMGSSTRIENEQQRISQISRALKGVAKELNVPVIALSQLSRANVQRKDDRDHRPMLSDLRDSGAIEQDADVVMFVHRKEYYEKENTAEEDRGKAEIIIEKQRNGPTGVVKVAFVKQYVLFEDLPDDEPPFPMTDEES